MIRHSQLENQSQNIYQNNSLFFTENQNDTLLSVETVLFQCLNYYIIASILQTN